MARSTKTGSPEPLLCKQCDGEGVIRDPFSDMDVVCPACDGEGVLWIDPSYVIAEEEDEYED